MQDKIRICWVVPNLEEYNTKWSMKVLYGLFKDDSRIEFNIIEYRHYNSWFFKHIYKPLSYYFYCWYTPQDFYYRKFFKENLKLALKGIKDPDFFFFPALPCCIDLKRLGFKGKVCLYTDCILTDLDKYRFNKPFKKLLSSYYRVKFENDIQKTDLIFTQNSWSAERFNSKNNLTQAVIRNIRFGVNLSFYYGFKDYNNKQLLIVLRKGGELVKGYKLLLKALPIIREKYPNVVLNVVGTDYGKDMEGVCCYYNQPRSVTEKLFKRASLYVMPAHREPNGVTYLEGLANKTPIVGLDRFAFPEFSGYGEWGFIVKKETPDALASVIIDALSNPNRLERMGKNGQKYVISNYKWSLVYEKIIDTLNEFIDR